MTIKDGKGSIVDLSIKHIRIPDAILALNPDIGLFWCFGDTNEEQLATLDYTANCENPSPNPTNITTEQILAKQAELQAIEDEKEATEDTNKTNANQKLLDLGLTQPEIDAFKRSINTIQGEVLTADEADTIVIQII